MNISLEVIEGLKRRYKDVHPMMFHRSCEKATSAGNLFDILENIPSQYPIIWSEEERCWIHTKDLFQSKNFDL